MKKAATLDSTYRYAEALDAMPLDGTPIEWKDLLTMITGHAKGGGTNAELSEIIRKECWTRERQHAFLQIRARSMDQLPSGAYSLEFLVVQDRMKLWDFICQWRADQVRVHLRDGSTR